MSARHPNPRLAKLARSYTVEEIARLYRKHPHTVRNWIADGLATVDSRRPTLIAGRDLRSYLERRRRAAKRPCPVGALYCFSCRIPRAPALGMADFHEREAGAGNIVALCEACGRPMHRRANAAMLEAVLPGIVIRRVRARPSIAEPSTSSSTTVFEGPHVHGKTQPGQ